MEKARNASDESGTFKRSSSEYKAAAKKKYDRMIRGSQSSYRKYEESKSGAAKEERLRNRDTERSKKQYAKAEKIQMKINKLNTVMSKKVSKGDDYRASAMKHEEVRVAMQQKMEKAWNKHLSFKNAAISFYDKYGDELGLISARDYAIEPTHGTGMRWG